MGGIQAMILAIISFFSTQGNLHFPNISPLLPVNALLSLCIPRPLPLPQHRMLLCKSQLPDCFWVSYFYGVSVYMKFNVSFSYQSVLYQFNYWTRQEPRMEKENIFPPLYPQACFIQSNIYSNWITLLILNL